MRHMILPTQLASLSETDLMMLGDLYRRGTPANTLRAWERDIAYITAWKQASFAAGLVWPESEAVALRFVLDHADDLDEAKTPARTVAEALIAQQSCLPCPGNAGPPHRVMAGFPPHAESCVALRGPLLRQARAKARRAAARDLRPKSENPIIREVLEAMLAACDHSHRGTRDRAFLMLGWASGGRRRAEVAALNRDDVADREYAAKGLIRLRLLTTKTTDPTIAPRLPLKGRAAQAVMLLDRHGRHRSRAAFPSDQPGGSSPAPAPLCRWHADDYPLPSGTGRLSPWLCFTSRVAVRLSDSGCA